MSANKKILAERRRATTKRFRILSFLTALLFVANIFVIRNTFSANNVSIPKETINQAAESAATPEPKAADRLNIPPQTTASRIKITLGETRAVPIAANSALVTSPEIASVEIKNGRELIISGLKIGETILIVSGDGKRQTFVVEVMAKPSVAVRQNLILDENAGIGNARMSGSYSILYAQGFEQSPSLVRNRLELRRELSNDRMLRVSGEMFKFFGGGDGQNRFGGFRNYGLDRISVGLDSPGKTIDFLDSQLRLSPASFNNIEMRGFHLTAAPKPSRNPDSTRRGIEVYAGIARPYYSFYDESRAKFVGAMLPVASGDAWQLRAGFISVAVPSDNRFGRGGTVLRLDGSYAPNKAFSADGEVGFAGGELSWSARLNLKLRKFGAFGEISRTDKNSPLAALDIISGGRRTEAFSVYWRPENRFNFSVSYSHTNFVRFTNSRSIGLNRSTFYANASYRPNRSSRLFLRFIDRQIETAERANFAKFQIAERKFTAGYEIRFNRHLSNDFEAGINFSREREAGSNLENGFDLREELRASFGRNSLTGFVNYTNKTPSLISLLVRNPQLLPLELQAAYALNPAQFLQINRDRLAFLLPGLELPQTRNLDAGVRFQTTAGRFNLSGEARYGGGSIFGQNQKNLLTSIGVDFRLDRANSIQVNGWHSFGGTYNQTAIIFGFTHRFGADSGGGFQFSKFLGFDKGKISGRVYYDLNGDGRDDEGEPGVSGLTVQLNEKRTIKTDADGRYQFSANEGKNSVALVSEDLGVRLNASTATVRQVSLVAHQTTNVSFGVSGFGFISGRVFNDLGLPEGAAKATSHGISGVRLVLRSLGGQTENFVAEQKSGSGGAYEFRNLRPGVYSLEIDQATLPVNFRLPAPTVWEIKVAPLAGFYLDIPIAAQRAVAGIVFVDKDGDGKFNAQIDEAVEGAIVTANDIVAVSDRSGAYIVRNLCAGKTKISVRQPFETINSQAFVELGSEPTTKRAFNIAVRR